MDGFFGLFWSFLKISAVSFGGGWAILGLIKVEMMNRNWLDERQFSELIGLAQITPGPVALNAATFTGFRLMGLAGAILASFSLLLIPTIIIFLVLWIKKRMRQNTVANINNSLRTVTIALVGLSFVSLIPGVFDSWLFGIFALLAFLFYIFTKINPFWIILVSGATGVFLEWIFKEGMVK